jgi:excisionase family DNA binding protein
LSAKRAATVASQNNDKLRAVNLEERWCLTVPEAARLLGISRNFAYQLARQGQLPVIKLGKRLLIPRVGLKKKLEGGAVQ